MVLQVSNLLLILTFAFEFMIFRLNLYYVLLCMLVSPTSSVWACGNGSSDKCGQTVSEKSCCSKKSGKKQAHCCEKQPGAEQNLIAHQCSEDGDCGGCQCPCGTTFCGYSVSLIATQAPFLPAILSPGDATLRLAFYFNQHMPEAVYLPIWQPPKLGV